MILNFGYMTEKAIKYATNNSISIKYIDNYL
jgi:hypothetical protein